MTNLSKQVFSELVEMKLAGIRVPLKAFKLSKNDLTEYQSMKASEIADLLISLASIK